MNRGKIGIIGCGRIAGHHARSIRENPGLTLISVCDLVEEKAKAYGEEFGVPFFTNYRTMLERHPEIDTVAVITPSGMHFEHAMEMIERFQKNVIVEKPTFLRSEQVKLAYEAAKKKGIEIFPVFQNRYNRAVQRVKRAVTATHGSNTGELGAPRIIAVRVRWCRPQRYYDLSPWRGTYAQDGGALTNQGIHHMDLLRHLGGEVEKVNCTMRTLGADIEVEDTAVGLVQFKSGAVGTVEVTTSARPDDFEASISIVGEKGLAQIGGIAVNELQIFTPDPSACSRESEDFSKSVYGFGHRALYGDIDRTLNHGIPFVISEQDCMSSISLLQAFYVSHDRSAWVAPTPLQDAKRLGEANEKLALLYRTPENETHV